MKEESLHRIDAGTLGDWLEKDKALLIDIREPDEYVREHIPGSRLVPLSGFHRQDFRQEWDKIAVFLCQSGARSEQAADQILHQTGFREVYTLEGGLQAWKAAGLPVTFNRKAPIAIMRQVQIVAGGLVLLGVLLALLVSPWFVALSAFVGAGLMFAGISGTCAMANLLRRMPWNRPLQAVPGRSDDSRHATA